MSADTDTRDTQTIDPARCGCALSERAPELHDRLLQFEDDGLEGAMRLWDDFAAREDHGFEEYSAEHLDWVWEQLFWVDFPDFVAEHNWRQPTVVAALARRIAAYFRSRLEAEKSLRALREISDTAADALRR